MVLLNVFAISLLTLLVPTAFVGLPGTTQAITNAFAQQTTSSSNSSSFILYYGLTDSSSLSRILAAHPSFVILNVTGTYANDAIAELHKNGIRAIGSVGVNYENMTIQSAISQTQKELQAGADGIFVDQTQSHSDGYLTQLHSAIKSYGSDKTVICNPGMIHVNENLTSTCDIISFEHEWPAATSLSWLSKYGPERFMGFNSDAGAKVGQPIGDAQKNLQVAHGMGIQYQYTTHDFVSLPPWLNLYKSGNSSAENVPPATAQVKFVSPHNSTIVAKVYPTNTTLYNGSTPATVRVPLNTTIEITWFNEKNHNYTSSSISGGNLANQTFDLALGNPQWGGMQRFHVTSDQLTYTDTADYS